ncbi:MAG: hypothetical protein QOK23_194, partial [Gammaproteobacteria bacterium]|nr:hypothetical protein [Gammaproteobacteria bacterium]
MDAKLVELAVRYSASVRIFGAGYLERIFASIFDHSLPTPTHLSGVKN